MKYTLAVAALCAAIALPSAAQARHKHYQRAIPAPVQNCEMDNNGKSFCVAGKVFNIAQTQVSHRATAEGPDPRPAAWCAWWLRRYLGIAKSAFPRGAYNLARSFASIGRPAQKGCTGCIAVFSRGRGGHVGLVESWDANGNPVILSGNFNHGVGVGAHPAKRLIALRWPA
jgi:uncharacterized protein (TIGR02594 family)